MKAGSVELTAVTLDPLKFVLKFGAPLLQLTRTSQWNSFDFEHFQFQLIGREEQERKCRRKNRDSLLNKLDFENRMKTVYPTYKVGMAPKMDRYPALVGLIVLE
jgi:hypothetical protein